MVGGTGHPYVNFTGRVLAGVASIVVRDRLPDGGTHPVRTGAGSGVWELGMKARRLIDGAAFGPDTLKAVGLAFDQAWAEIAGNFGSTQVENARLRLAEEMLSVATEGSTDVAAIKAGALQAMATFR